MDSQSQTSDLSTRPSLKRAIESDEPTDTTDLDNNSQTKRSKVNNGSQYQHQEQNDDYLDNDAEYNGYDSIDGDIIVDSENATTMSTATSIGGLSEVENKLKQTKVGKEKNTKNIREAVISGASAE